MQKVQEYILLYKVFCNNKKLSLNVSTWFQALFTHKLVLFHLSLTVLLHYRTIKKVLVLVDGPTFLQPGFHESQFTPNLYPCVYYRTSTFFGKVFCFVCKHKQTLFLDRKHTVFNYFHLRSPLQVESPLIFSSKLLRCFNSLGK